MNNLKIQISPAYDKDEILAQLDVSMPPMGSFPTPYFTSSDHTWKIVRITNEDNKIGTLGCFWALGIGTHAMLIDFCKWPSGDVEAFTGMNALPVGHTAIVLVENVPGCCLLRWYTSSNTHKALILENDSKGNTTVKYSDIDMWEGRNGYDKIFYGPGKPVSWTSMGTYLPADPYFPLTFPEFDFLYSRGPIATIKRMFKRNKVKKLLKQARN